jgi:hypothetical protein
MPVRVTALDARGPALRGPTAIGALALGAGAFGAVAIGRIAIRRAAIKHVAIGDLEVRRLRVEDLEIVNERRPSGTTASAMTHPPRPGGNMSNEETGGITGTKDKDYNLIWFVEACLSNALRMETYAQDADREGDGELADFFRRAQGESRKGAEQGKELLRRRLSS